MKPTDLTVATWNIAEAYRSKSTDQFDYHDVQDAAYFVSQLKNLNPDIICLQESQCNDERSLSKEIADALGFKCIFETATHRSHISPGYSSSLAILARGSFKQMRTFVQPYPSFDLFLPNGKPAFKLDEYVQLVSFDGFAVANIKTQPMEFLGHAYETELGRQYAAELSKMFTTVLPSPIVFAGDFNTPDPAVIFADGLAELGLTDALPNEPTKPDYHGHLDCMFVSKQFNVIKSGIIKTESDHFLGWAKLAIS